jgi:hypothetical protein
MILLVDLGGMGDFGSMTATILKAPVKKREDPQNSTKKYTPYFLLKKCG